MENWYPNSLSFIVTFRACHVALLNSFLKNHPSITLNPIFDGCIVIDDTFVCFQGAELPKVIPERRERIGNETQKMKISSKKKQKKNEKKKRKSPQKKCQMLFKYEDKLKEVTRQNLHLHQS
jgi:hypothetical protein